MEKTIKPDPDSVLVICAHSDDQIIGPGGTIIKYAKEGKKVHTIIYSYGELTHPWLQKKVAITTRVKESKDADKFIGGHGVFFLGLDEGKFSDQFKNKKMHQKLRRLIALHKPSRIFTHSVDDPHVDHRAVVKTLLETLDKMRYNCEVYMFDVWTFINFKKSKYPKIYIDISTTFNKKIQALKFFESQIVARISLTWSIYWKAWIHGKGPGSKYAEVFFKIR